MPRAVSSVIGVGASSNDSRLRFRVFRYERPGIAEASQHVASDTRHVVDVARMGQAASPGNRTYRENRAAGCRLEEDHVTPRLRVLWGGKIGQHVVDLLRRRKIKAGQSLRRRQNQCMSW